MTTDVPDETAKDTVTEDLTLDRGDETIVGTDTKEPDDDEATQDQGKDPVEVDIVSTGIRGEGTTGTDVVVDSGEAQTTSHTSNGPGSEDNTVAGTNVLTTKHIGEEGRDDSKASTVASGEDEHASEETTIVPGVEEGWEDDEDDTLGGEEEAEDGLSAYTIGDGGKDETTSKVETPVDGDDGGSGGGITTKEILDHVGETGDDDETKDGVGEEHKVHDEVLAGSERLDEGETDDGRVHGGDVGVPRGLTGGYHGTFTGDGLDVPIGGIALGVGSKGGGTALGLDDGLILGLSGGELLTVRCHALDGVTRWGDTDDEGAGEHDDEVDGGEDGEGDGKAEVTDKGTWDLGKGDTPSPEATDGKASGHTTKVREPFLQGRHGGDVGETQAETTDDTVSHVDEPELLCVDGQGSEAIADDEEGGSDEGGLHWTIPLEPWAHDGGGETKATDGNVEGDGGHTFVGITIEGIVNGLVEDGPSVE